MPKHGACICVKGTDLPCKVGEEALSQDSTAVRSGEFGLLATSACPEGLSSAFLSGSAACDLPEEQQEVLESLLHLSHQQICRL